MKTKLHLVPLEKYVCRYTEFLEDWEREAFGKLFNVESVYPAGSTGQTGTLDITTGEVLDSVARPEWALGQSIAALNVLKTDPLAGQFYFSDFYHPGLDALPYSRFKNFRAYSFLWAQTFDQYDFTQMFLPWMRPWEQMAFEIYTGVFVADPLLADLIKTSCPFAPVHVVGLPFNSSTTFNVLGSLPPERGTDVLYSSRFDLEKNPDFFLDLVESMPELQFVICTGHPKLKGTATDAVTRAKQLAARPASNLVIHEGLTKERYYYQLASAKVQFNCASQDWVSFTLLEALTFGCAPCYPNSRSFPNTIKDMDFMYVPGELQSAASCLFKLTAAPHRSLGSLRTSILGYHDGTLSRIADIVQN